MTRMSKVLMTAMLFFLTLTIGMAQQGAKEKSPEQRAERKTAKMTENLGLTTEQQKKVYEINLKYSNQMAATKPDATEKEARKKAMHKIMNDKQAELKSVLTADQITKHEAMKNKGHKDKKMKGRKDGAYHKNKKDIDPDAMAKRKTEHMIKQLNLSPAQAAEIQQINLKYAKATADIIKSDQPREEKKQLMKQIHMDKQTDLTTILTPAQLEIRAKQKEEHKHKKNKHSKDKGPHKGDRS